MSSASIASPLWQVVELAGKLGPLVIAWLVYDNNRQQSAWQRGAILHGAKVESQKVRLELMERRINARDIVDDIWHRFFMKNELTKELIQQFSEVYLVIEMIFSDEVCKIAHPLMPLMRHYRRELSAFERGEPSTASFDRNLVTQEDIDELYGRLEDGFFELRYALKAEIRVYDIEPFEVPIIPARRWPTAEVGLAGLVRLTERERFGR